jgi:hypothetical protein
MGSRDTYVKPTLKAGTLAYWVTYWNRYSVKVISVAARENPVGGDFDYVAEIQFTRAAGGYKRGERTTISARYNTLMPRECYHVKRGSLGRLWYSIPGGIEADKEESGL